jgi:hypothetical protein
MSDGETIEEAITNGLDAMRGWTDAMPARASVPRTDPLRGGMSCWPTCPRHCNPRLYSWEIRF